MEFSAADAGVFRLSESAGAHIIPSVPCDVKMQILSRAEGHPEWVAVSAAASQCAEVNDARNLFSLNSGCLKVEVGRKFLIVFNPIFWVTHIMSQRLSPQKLRVALITIQLGKQNVHAAILGFFVT